MKASKTGNDFTVRLEPEDYEIVQNFDGTYVLLLSGHQAHNLIEHLEDAGA